MKLSPYKCGRWLAEEAGWRENKHDFFTHVLRRVINMNIGVKYSRKDVPSQLAASQAHGTASQAMHRADEIPTERDDRSTTPQRMTAYSTAALFRGAREIEIELNGEIFRLRITRQGKLILNK
jgi:hemin uptake protein HemP